MIEGVILVRKLMMVVMISIIFGDLNDFKVIEN